MGARLGVAFLLVRVRGGEGQLCMCNECLEECNRTRETLSVNKTRRRKKLYTA